MEFHPLLGGFKLANFDEICRNTALILQAEACFTLPCLTRKACYRLALRPPVGPMRIPELTFRLL